MIAVSVHVGIVVEFRRTGETANWADLEYSHFKKSRKLKLLPKPLVVPLQVEVQPLVLSQGVE